jgi:hypothetical protein
VNPRGPNCGQGVYRRQRPTPGERLGHLHEANYRKKDCSKSKKIVDSMLTMTKEKIVLPEIVPQKAVLGHYCEVNENE